MALDYTLMKNWQIAEVRQHYTNQDVILYALGLGAAVDNPVAAGDLQFVYERGLQCLPTYATLLAGSGDWLADPKLGIDLNQVLHGEQFLTIHQPLPAEGVVLGHERVEEIYDKGAAKGAVLYMRRELRDQAGTLLATSGWSVFMRGNGGFGGDASGQPAPRALPVERGPDASIDLITRPEQAVLYRLSGDANALHIDPAVAASAGFARPILHGMCTYGIAGRAVLKLCCDNQAARLKQLDVRFASPVYPGETLRTELWHLGQGRAAFRVRVVERDLIVLNNGYAEFTEV